MIEQPLPVHPIARDGFRVKSRFPSVKTPMNRVSVIGMFGFAHRPMDDRQPLTLSQTHVRCVADDQAKKIEELTAASRELESAMREVARPYSELVEQLARFQDTVQKYFRLMDLYQRHGSISIETILPEVKDPISKDIVKVLLDKPGLNISEITEELRERRGSSSRRIVRDRLGELVEQGMVDREVGQEGEDLRDIRAGGQEMVRSARIDQIG